MSAEYKDAALRYIENPDLRDKIGSRIDASDDVWLIATVLSAVVSDEMKKNEGLAINAIRSFVATGVDSSIAEKRLQQIESAIKALPEIRQSDNQAQLAQITTAFKKELAGQSELIMDSLDAVRRTIHKQGTAEGTTATYTPGGLSALLESRGLVYAVTAAALLSLAAGFFAGYSMGEGRGRQAAQADAVRVVQQALALSREGGVRR